MFLTFGLFMAFAIPAGAAGPDGFAGVPWGATLDQVDQAMRDRGFQQLSSPASNIRFYSGSFGGYGGTLQFNFFRNALYAGQFNTSSRGNYNWVQQVGTEFVNTVTAKYGSYSKAERNSGWYYTWDGLREPSSGDSINAWVWVFFNYGDKDLQTSASGVMLGYTNAGLLARLQAQQKQQGGRDW
jgi:hypothetical protein